MKSDKNLLVKSFRSLKISSIIKKKLSNLLVNMNDKRIGIITINKIIISKDLRYAKIYIFFLNNLSIKETIKILNNSSSYLRNQLSKHSNLNFIPKINFYYDKSIMILDRINSLLKVNEKQKKK